MQQQDLEKTAALNHWNKIGGIQPCHGLVTPLLALRTKQTLGCGDFGALRSLVDWIASTPMKLVQLLPLHDSGDDASPYAALSGFSLNPLYIDLSKAPLELCDREKLKEMESLPRVDYRALRTLKMDVLRALVARGYGKQLLQTFNPDASFHHLRLDRYARFMALKDYYDQKPWWEWPLSSIDDLKELQPQVQFYQVVQLIAHSQLSEVSTYARSKGVHLVGDIPILLCKDSAEVFFERQFFNLDFEAGAPADQFSPQGQCWGFPIYNWYNLHLDGYSWWQDRIRWSGEYFDLYRLDHVAGFFGIWSIPPGKKAVEGFYEPQDPKLRLELGRARLQALLEASDKLPIGEDLGHIDPRIRDCLLQMGIPGMKVMRWHRHWDTDGTFIKPEDYQKMSLACVSTHDCSTLRMWFDEDIQAAQSLSKELGVECPKAWNTQWSKSILQACHHTGSAIHLNLLVDYLDAFEELCAKQAQDYRLNLPGVVQDCNWTLRYEQTISQLASYTPLQEFFKELCS